ncbi:hypothetical protein PIB30_055221 [Stylosanthes scabra]|uniref:Uncharacterized protein n=1 Tax=Stylosanthes scabra TaxID=79078 RepID=A0ABU6TIV6_9FABA|nr:hypothetical protein [Stylosanthes scabra]
MAKHFAVVVAVLVVAFCFSSALAAAPAPAATATSTTPNKNYFVVQGKIYCDPCRVEFETRLSHPLSDIKVTLECKRIDDEKNITYTVETTTDKQGYYDLPVYGDHQDEICQVKTERSTHPKCKEPMKHLDTDRIMLTKNDGVSSAKRFVNPLGFMTRNIDARCVQIAQELGMLNTNANGQSEDS